jgi:hypothetical protein
MLLTALKMHQIEFSFLNKTNLFQHYVGNWQKAMCSDNGYLVLTFIYMAIL